ncbi:hypothetical protein [Microvirga roseola]|uniref:hypothetical protein n=1 Tax=Microvirga roseola TaxID=2883126 RepID=UPI001E653DCD|nr:hypothetical protein [Microvirga roseola]
MNGQSILSESIGKITAGLFDQVRGSIPIPATEENEAAVAYLIPMQGAAQDIIGHGTMILMIRPARPENKLLDVVRTRFGIGPGAAHRIARLVSAASPRLATALLTSTTSFETTLDRFLGASETRQEAQLAAFLSSFEASSPRDLDLSRLVSAAPVS